MDRMKSVDGERIRRVATRCASCLVALALLACTPMSREEFHADPEAPVKPGGSQAMQLMLERILADAAQRTGLPRDEVKVLTVESVTWADGALGCPEPGMMYTQALVRGYRVRVDAAGTTLLYHAGTQHTFVHCPPERAQGPSPLDPT